MRYKGFELWVRKIGKTWHPRARKGRFSIALLRKGGRGYLTMRDARDAMRKAIDNRKAR